MMVPIGEEGWMAAAGHGNAGRPGGDGETWSGGTEVSRERIATRVVE